MQEEEKQSKLTTEVVESEKPTPDLVVSPSEEAPSLTVVADPGAAGAGITQALPTTIQDPFVGTLLAGRYQILSLIGNGATSAVYKAMDTNLQHDVAVKILQAHLTSDAEIVKRFNQEVRAASLINHSNVVAIHDSSSSPGGQPYFVMTYVDGFTLQQIIQQSGWVPVDRALSIFAQVCAALSAAHERGVVHRDLKPSNIMVEKSADGHDFVRVLDFGVAKVLPMQGETFQKLTQTGEMLGSLLYMSPEQCLDQDVDVRSDIYSLGCVLYEAVTGKPPLCGRTAFETMNKHMSETPERLDRVRPDLHFPKALEQVIFKAMAKRPESRYESVSKFLDDLQALPAVSSFSLLKDDADSGFISNPGAPVNSEFNMAALAQKEIDRKKWTRFFVLVLAVVQIFVATVIMACLTIYVHLGGLVITIQAVAFLLMTVLILKIWARIGSQLPRMVHAQSVISRVKPTKLLVAKVDKVPDEMYSYWIEVSAAQDAHLSKARFKIERTGSLSQYSSETQLWDALCSASKLAEFGQTSVFPIACQAYIDPSGQDPVAIAINDMLTWVVP